CNVAIALAQDVDRALDQPVGSWPRRSYEPSPLAARGDPIEQSVPVFRPFRDGHHIGRPKQGLQKRRPPLGGVSMTMMIAGPSLGADGVQFTPEVIEEIKDLVTQGISRDEIASRL